MIVVGTICGHRRTLLLFSDRQRSLGSTFECDRCSIPECRAVVCDHGAGQQEDIDALPVEEQAAIVCANRASDVPCPEQLDEEMLADGPVATLVWRAYVAARDFHGGSPRRGRMTWALAEALLRTGEVRP